MEFAQLFYNAGRDRNYWEKNSLWDIYFVLPSQIWIHSLIKTFWIRHAGLYAVDACSIVLIRIRSILP